MPETENQKDRIVRGATELFMRVGLRSVSMDDIARQLGMSKKTLYQFVANKEALIDLVMADEACRDMSEVNKNRDEAADAIDEFLRNSRYFIRSMREVSPTTLHDLQKYYPQIWHARMKEHFEGFKESLRENIERGMEEGLYRDDLDAELIASFYVGMMMMIIDTSIFPAQDRPLTEIIRQHSMYHFNGIVNQFGRERIEQYLKQENLD